MEYERLAKSYEYGLSKHLRDGHQQQPVYAYLLEGNSLVDQKLVMAHVYGHVDFFKNNFWFSAQTEPQDDRRDGEPRHARPRATSSGTGINKVEDFIDACLCLENLIDPHTPVHRSRRAADEAREDKATRGRSAEAPSCRPRTTWSRFINPEECLESSEEEPRRRSGQAKKFPERARARRPPVPARPRAARALGARHASRSSARRPTTSCRRGRRRS